LIQTPETVRERLDENLPLPHPMDWNFVLTLKTDRRKFPP